jgi:hypothetical protein
MLLRMETELTEQQSLEVISEMIKRARNNIQKMPRTIYHKKEY